MAKTTNRPKPVPSQKTEVTGSATPDGAADIRMIPLDQLETSPLNVRKVAASASDDAELLASIRETGIKQNLVVHELSESRFAVDAGGRRLKALKQLADDGVIHRDHPVPCLSRTSATPSSPPRQKTSSARPCTLPTSSRPLTR